MTGASVKFGIFFGVLGLALSLIFSIFSGNGWIHILLVVLGCTTVSALLGVVVFTILQARVPEFFQVFGGLAGSGGSTLSGRSPMAAYTEEEPVPRSQGQGPGREENISSDEETVAAAISSLSSVPASQPQPGRHFGDHIIVDKVKIKNEPRLMAQAIRTMLTKDD